MFGFPLSYFENSTNKVNSNYKLLETVATAGVQHHVEIMNGFLSQVSRELFSLFEVLLSSPMRVKLTIKEGEVLFVLI